jgi:hypothetical protein
MLRSLAWGALLLPTIALGALYGRGESLVLLLKWTYWWGG